MDAQAALPHHARVHAQGGHARPRHDVPHLHGSGQPRFRLRGGHGAEIPRRTRAAAGGYGAVRQLAVHRGRAQRLPQLPLTDLGRHRPGPHRHVAVRVRGRHGLRALRGVHAGRADVLRKTARPDGRRLGAVVPRFHGWPATGTARRETDGRGLGRPPDDRFPGGATEAVPGDARRRRRPVGRAVRAYHQPSAGTSPGTGRWTNAYSCATRCRALG